MEAKIASSPKLEREYRARLLAKSSGVTFGFDAAADGGQMLMPVTFIIIRKSLKSKSKSKSLKSK
jgi:hypothetical protein